MMGKAKEDGKAKKGKGKGGPVSKAPKGKGKGGYDKKKTLAPHPSPTVSLHPTEMPSAYPTGKGGKGGNKKMMKAVT